MRDIRVPSLPPQQRNKRTVRHRPRRRAGSKLSDVVSGNRFPGLVAGLLSPRGSPRGEEALCFCTSSDDQFANLTNLGRIFP